MKDTIDKRKKLPDRKNVLIYQIYRSGRLLRYYMQKLLDTDPYPMTQEQFLLLYQVYAKDGQSQRELADEKLNDYSNITRIIDQLEKKGYVHRRPDPKDRRTFNIVLSEAGKIMFDEITVDINREEQKIMKGITREEVEIVKRVLGKIERNLEE